MSAPSLTDFLLARIAEREAVAKEATPGPWKDVAMGSEGSIVLAGGNTITTSRKPATCREFADAEHIALNDPAYVLAECEAKLRIVELHAVEVRREWVNPLDGPAYQEDEFSCAICDWFPSGEGCDTIKALAEPYADHPDYQEEWRPQPSRSTS